MDMGATIWASVRVPFILPLLFLARNGYLPNSRGPRRFNELIHERKLHDRSPLLPVLTDKIKVKAYVTERLGPDWVIPTFWSGTDLPSRIQWPLPFVVKSNHGSQQCRFVRSADVDWDAIRKKAAFWLRRPYANLLGEWAYSQIERSMLIEPFVGCPTALPVDYKFFVFGGRVEFIQVDTDREHRHKRTMFDRDWQRLPLRLGYPVDPRPIDPPASLSRMIAAAETLGRDFDFVRVDLYDVDGTPLFGEMSFYPNSGLDRFSPTHFDDHFGKLWRDASQAKHKQG